MNPTQQAIDDMAPWFHNLHLPDGTQTNPHHPLGDFPLFKWNDIKRFIPQDLSGWSVLDIGCNAGFYSLELALRGGSVTAIDIDEHYLMQARWAAAQFNVGHRIRFDSMQVYDLAHGARRFDIVWFMGVFYHLRYPFLALDIVSRLVGRLLVFQTMTLPDRETYEDREALELAERDVLLEPGRPKMAFIEHSIAGDPTNWWVPNHGAVVAMLHSLGLSVIHRPAHEIYICTRCKPLPPEEDQNEQEYRAATGIGRERIAVSG